MMGWWSGILIAAVIVRFGQRIQTLAWSGVVVLMPFCGVFYPISILPDWARVVAFAMPGAYVFEGMRAFLATNVFPMSDLLISLGLNGVYLVISLWIFGRCFEKSREMGLGRLE